MCVRERACVCQVLCSGNGLYRPNNNWRIFQDRRCDGIWVLRILQKEALQSCLPSQFPPVPAGVRAQCLNSSRSECPGQFGSLGSQFFHQRFSQRPVTVGPQLSSTRPASVELPWPSGPWAPVVVQQTGMSDWVKIDSLCAFFDLPTLSLCDCCAHS